MSSVSCKSLPAPALHSFFEELMHQTQINSIQIQCDNAKKPAFCWYKNCCRQNSLSRKNNSMPDMKSSRGNCKHDSKLDTTSSKSKRRLTRPTSMPNISAKKDDHMISRWTGGESCDTRPVLNAYWSDDLSSCSSAFSPKSPKSPLCLRQIHEFPPQGGHSIPLHQRNQQQQHSLPNYNRALEMVRQKYATGGITSMKLPRGKGKRSSYRSEKKRGGGGQPLKCVELLIPPVRRQSIEDEDLSCELMLVLPLTVGDISP